MAGWHDLNHSRQAHDALDLNRATQWGQTTFALAYADQVERDHHALLAAVKAGEIAVLREE